MAHTTTDPAAPRPDDAPADAPHPEDASAAFGPSHRADLHREEPAHAARHRLTDRWRTHHREPPRNILAPSFSGVGLVLGAFFIAISLEPSLLPRIPVVQGLASGVSFMLGYGLGAGGHAVWNFLQVPNLRGRARTIVVTILLGVIGITLATSIWRWVGWQNQIRQTFGMEDLQPTAWPVVIGVGLLTAAAVLGAARCLRALFRWAGDTLDRWLPHRLSITLSSTILLALLWLVTSGLLVDGFFAASSALFSTRDNGDKPTTVITHSELRSGGEGSLIAWEDLGRQGRNFVSTAPTVNELDTWSGGGAVEPIRVYVGLKSADTIQDRAQLLLDELIRTGAFDREILVLGTTTGTGFLQPNAVDSLEFLFNGDTAIAGLQYSYLPSWISLLADQEAVREASQVSFRVVHDYWSQLPEDSRPRLYLYGLSLGSFGVESVLSNLDILNEPVDGALLAGPPFVNPLQNELTRDRDPGSAAWMPVVSEGRTVRFTGEEDILDQPTGDWGDTKVVYFQHGSDPVVFFDPTVFIREPEWLQGPERAPDVSAEMSWFPLVTGWQTLLDMPGAGAVPWGYGHMYSATGNLQAWVALTAPEDWDDARTAALAAHLEARLAQQEDILERLGD